MSPEIQNPVDTGSFRDRNGRVYVIEDRVIRGLSERALSDFEQLTSLNFYPALVDRGALVETRRLPVSEVPLPDEARREWAGFVEHQRIPVITYPYEWTFGMLKDAALLQLDLLESAIGEGMTIKDATPYNFQFHAGHPVFIDIASFEKLQPGSPWAGYRQFCEMFLFPLMLQAYKGIDFQPQLRAEIDGIGLQTAAKLFGFRDRFRSGVFSHVWLQSRLDRRFNRANINVRADLASAGFNQEMILANVRRLRRLVEGLKWDGAGSEWGAYQELHNYSETDHRLKESFIDECVAASGVQLVWDIGSNTGRFSRIAGNHARRVIAMDKDHFAVERLYREIREQGGDGILPLVQNVANPSPCWGWNNQERLDLQSRARPGLIMCLALVHHVVISSNIPLPEFIRWLAGLADQLIIEFISREDEKVQILLRNKSEEYGDYSRANFERALSASFRIEKTQVLDSGNRFLYWCRRP